MKTKIISLFLVLTLGSWITSQKASAQRASVNFQVFYDELSPYGTWVDNPRYGYVWVPDAGPGFIPYHTNGHWVLTDDGWAWVSNYPWGWAPFHYGRWYTDSTYGPMWVPDNEWAPAWVTWRSSGDYYGWAPIEPGISISLAFGNSYNPPPTRWTFVRNNDFGRENINNYYVNTTNNVTIIKNTTVINNTHVDRTRNVTYHAGPPRTDVEKHVGRTIAPVHIVERSKPGQNISNNQLQIYRPQVQKGNSNGHKPAPTRVAALKDVKPVAQRPAESPGQRSNQAARPATSQPQHNAQPAKEQPSRTQPARQPAKVQPKQTQPVRQPTKEQPTQSQPRGQSTKEQPKQAQPAKQAPKEQPSQSRGQTTRQQSSQPQSQRQPTKEQPKQAQSAAKQQPAQPQPAAKQPARQQPAQVQPERQPARPQPSQPRGQSKAQPSKPQPAGQTPKQEPSKPKEKSDEKK